MADFEAFVAAGPRARAWRSRSTSRCSARRTTRGSSEHPEWFTTKPDGTIAYAENPPKKYQDIYPLNFDNDPKGLYAECLRVLRVWIDAGVRIFRVDNPHTKPINFWQWLIAEVTQDRPGRAVPGRGVHPAGDDARARQGRLHQSYTYFTWRNEQGRAGGVRAANWSTPAHYMRPNFFVNTPDILPDSPADTAGRRMFAIRAVLAAMLSPTWGVYSGYELFEHLPLRPGAEEYLDSEKYQLRPRDFAGALADGRSLAPLLAQLNEIRREHPALHRLRNLHFHDVDNPRRHGVQQARRADRRHRPRRLHARTRTTWREATLTVDLPALGLDWGDGFRARICSTGEDLPTGASTTTSGSTRTDRPTASRRSRGAPCP